MLTILCIATYFKGDAFLRECRRQGCRVLLLTSDALAGAAWPRESIDDVFSIAREATEAEIRRRVDAIARTDRSIGLPRSTTSTSSWPRCCASTCSCRGWDAPPPAISATSWRCGSRRALAIPVPEFSPVFNDQALDDWTRRVPRAMGPRSRGRRRPRSASRRSPTATSSGARSTRRAISGPTACSNSS